MMDSRYVFELTTDEIHTQMHAQERFIREALQLYEPTYAILAWFDTLRAIEECINLVTADWSDEDEDFFLALIRSPFDRFLKEPCYLLEVRQRMTMKFSANAAARFNNLLVQSFAIGHSFAHHGLHDAVAGFADVGSLMGYFQSRRRHLVAMLHMMPSACMGGTLMAPLDTLNVVLPLVELYGIPRSGGQSVLNVRAARQKLGLPEASQDELPLLDELFLEPERASITHMPLSAETIEALKSREALREDRLFSAAELHNDIKLIEAGYAEFDLSATEYPACAKLIKKLAQDHINRDFWIAITPPDLQRLFRRYDASAALQNAFVNSSSDYEHCLSTYAPMVLVGGVYRSTVTLLSRFLYNWRARVLDRKKRYQIRSGFIFEDAVAAELKRLGFNVQQITRINRAEFDVVTIRDGVIWNVQCKNNFTPLDRVDSNAERFAKFNRALVRSYEKALNKEVGREHLVKQRLGIDRIQHVVVSRFPVVCDNPRIVPFSRIGQFLQRTAALSE
jgi:hypothetical protein